MQYNSVEERTEAIDNYDEDNGNPEELSDIQNAEIVEKPPEEVAETPTQSEETQETTEEKPTFLPSEEEEAKETPPEETQAETPAEPKTYTITDKDLPEGYKSVGDVLKAFGEQKSLIERQNEKIQKDVDRYGNLEGEIAKLKEARQAPQEQQESKQTTVNLEDAKKNVVNLATEYKSAMEVDQFSEKSAKLQLELQNANFAYSQNLETSLENHQKALQKEADQRKQLTENERALEKEYQEIAKFSDDHKEEYGLSKAPQEVEKVYVDWGKKVAAQFYGRPANNWDEVRMALMQLENGNPSLTNNCQLAGLQTTPDQDVANYQKISDLVAYRDGKKYNPDGSFMYSQRYNPETSKNEVVKFPSIKSALENKRVSEGYYRKKESDAYNKGVNEHRKALEQRDTNVLSNATDDSQAGDRTLTKVRQEIDDYNEDTGNWEDLAKLQLEEVALSKNAQGSIKY